jgi:hypothetical protein
MQITLNIPDADAPQIVNGICAATNFDAGSGKTKAEWAKEKVVGWIKDTAKRGQLISDRASIVAAVDNISIT